jgi:uncharacterized low-complexity protein
MRVVPGICLLHLLAQPGCARDEGNEAPPVARSARSETGQDAERRQTSSSTGCEGEHAADGACDEADTDADPSDADEGRRGEGSGGDDEDAAFIRELGVCAQAGAAHDPTTIAATLALIDDLPHPVTIPCLLASLPRPLEIAATDSELSAQPSGSRTYPRIFIRRQSLLLSVVPTGIGSRNLELSELDAGGTHSLKGDLRFPVTEALAPDAPYAPILNDAGNGTLCAACHGGERRAGGDQPKEAHLSIALRPHDAQLVPLAELEAVVSTCGHELDDACRMLRSLYRGGEAPTEYTFPATLATFQGPR